MVPEPGDDCSSVHRQQCYLNMDDIMSESIPWVRRSQQRLRLRLTMCSGSSTRINRYLQEGTGVI